ncbi:uncharacterized protein BDW43DRAFT_317294 [Aspergillus alliaceus]|uniref:uncharacterized protein n=1 Tax=Petromyces alliaceus TaxID=209559 RepID=UPI0012A57A5B|nr:uncharacterized protein BDW43DRAFT_317294 [Aspergillus alliaceus]KAB8226942.1 hypothetical protein BDW43DRAFT_317294 [Aspergillus alliaceus]
MSGSAAIYAAAFDKRARAAVPSSFCIGGGQNCEPMAFIDRIAPTLFLMVVSDNDVEAVTAAQLRHTHQRTSPSALLSYVMQTISSLTLALPLRKTSMPN